MNFPRLVFLLGFFLPLIVAQQTHEFTWTLSAIMATPDGKKERPVVAVNGEFPLPVIRIKRKDRVIINLINNLEESTSLHFHGIFQEGSTFMDGAGMISQCPIPPGSKFTYDFVVNSQSGTFWYHSHDAAQYGDGFRGAFIVEDADEDENKIDHDDDLVVLLSDWYHHPSSKLVDELFEPKGASEPLIDSSLFNETHDVRIVVEPNKTYYLRLINAGMSASQFFAIEDHDLTIIEVDGVKTEPVVVDSVKLATGQRYGVLLKTKDSKDKNYGVVQMTNIMMSKKIDTGWLVYNDDLKPEDREPYFPPNANKLKYIDDFELVPKGSIPKLPKPDHEISFIYNSEYLGEKFVLYYTMNSNPHISPKVPTLHTLFSANESTVLNPLIYGELTNSFLIKKGDVVQITVNSADHMRHPFHLHGHNFQVISKAKGKHFTYDESLESEFPEFPMIRDTMEVPARGYITLRFIANNPGVWFFHCHTEWHAVKGLGVVFIEAADEVLETQGLCNQFYEICEAGGLPSKGNAAGNKDLLNLDGQVLLKELGNEKPTTEAIPTQSIAPTATTPTPTTKVSSAKTTAPTSHNDKPKGNKAPTPTTTRIHKGKHMHPSSTPDDASTVSLKTQTVVMIVYFIIMCSIAGVIALFVHNNTKKKGTGALINDYE